MYPYAFQVVLGLLIVLPVALTCMLIAGMFQRWLRLRQGSGEGLTINHTCRKFLQIIQTTASIMRPMIVVADILTDALTIAEVWPAWVAYVLLGAVFIPDLLASTTLAVCFCKTCRNLNCARAFEKGLQAQVVDNRDTAPPGVVEDAAIGPLQRFMALLARPVSWFEGVIVSFYGKYPYLLWRMVASILLWPIYMLWVPLLLLYGGLCKSLLVSPPQKLKFLRLDNLYVLYDRSTGALEAPLSAGLLLMLLIIGVKPENKYVIEQTVFLYASLTFSIVHMLSLWWDMVHLATTSLSWREWWKRVNEPWHLAGVKQQQPGSEEVGVHDWTMRVVC
jgi:hypothetical protein